MFNSTLTNNNGNNDRQSLEDNSPVLAAEAFRYGVVITVPTLYINTDDTRSNLDRSAHNLRVIPYDELKKLTQLAIKVYNMNYNAQIELCAEFMQYLINDLNETNASQKDEFLKLMKYAIELGSHFELDREYYDIVNNGICFDVIRQYVNDQQTTLLQSAEATSVNGIRLYSQLDPEDTTTYTKIREMTNDTDLNRILYQMNYFENSLLMKSDYLLTKSSQLINIVLFYTSVLTKSRPINLAQHHLKSMFIGYMMDLCIRTRLIQMWQITPSCKILLDDLIKNYSESNFLVQLCKKNTASERAKYFIKSLRADKNLQDISTQFNYDNYIKILSDFIIMVEGQSYYNFNTEFLLRVTMDSSFASLTKVLNRSTFGNL